MPANIFIMFTVATSSRNQHNHTRTSQTDCEGRMVDRIFRTRSLGVAAAGLPDQYADGKAAKVWELYLGSRQERTSMYRQWFTNLLRKRSIRRVLDVACGTGVDSVMLIEEGFSVVSTDASDKMLKVALKERWNRRKEEAIDKWDEDNYFKCRRFRTVHTFNRRSYETKQDLLFFQLRVRFRGRNHPVPKCSTYANQMRNQCSNHAWAQECVNKILIEEANWLTLPHDLESLGNPDALPGDGFDAIICLGNSFAHLPDLSGNQFEHKIALSNMRDMLKTGGILVIDHRNYDYILKTGHAPRGKNVYYPSDHIKKIKTSNLYVDGQPLMITLDYTMDITAIMTEQQLQNLPKLSEDDQLDLKFQNFRLSYYPHTLDGFNNIITEVFGDVDHEVYGDFKVLSEISDPAYYIHIITK